MQRFKKIAFKFCLFIGICFLLKITFPFALDYFDMKSFVLNQVSKHTPYSVRIDGRINVQLLPMPALVLNSIAVTPQTDKDPTQPLVQLSAQSLAVSADLWELLHGVLSVKQIQLDTPIIHLKETTASTPSIERRDTPKPPLKNGLNTPTTTLPQGTPAAQRPTESALESKFKIHIDVLKIKNGKIIYKSKDNTNTITNIMGEGTLSKESVAHIKKLKFIHKNTPISISGTYDLNQKKGKLSCELPINSVLDRAKQPPILAKTALSFDLTHEKPSLVMDSTIDDLDLRDTQNTSEAKPGKSQSERTKPEPHPADPRSADPKKQGNASHSQPETKTFAERFSNEPLSLEWLNGCNARFQVKINTFRLNALSDKTPLTQVRLKGTLQKGRLVIDALSAQYNESPLKGSFTLSKEALGATFSIQNLDVSTLKAIEGTPLRSGRATFDITVQSQPVSVYHCINGLTGEFTVSLQKAVLEAFDIKNAVKTLKAIKQPEDVFALQGIFGKKALLTVHSLKGKGTLSKGGIVQTQDLTLDAPEGSILTQGTLNLDKQKLDLNALLTVANAGDIPPISFSVSGAMSNPTLKIDQKKLTEQVIKNVGTRIIKREAGKAVLSFGQKLLERALGG